MLSSRALRWAIVVSICVHLLLLFSGRGYWAHWFDDEVAEEDETMAVRILPRPTPPKPTKPAPKPQPKPKPQAKPAQKSQLPATPPAPVLQSEASAGVSAAPAAGAASGAAGGASTGAASAPRPPAADESTPLLSPDRALPGSGHMRFLVTKGEGGFIVGRAVHDWKVEGDRYELHSTIETAGLVSLFVDVKFGQTSIGHVDAQGLHPDTFLDVRKDGQYRSEFDWAQGRLRLSNGSSVALASGSQDLLSMFYQLGLIRLPPLTGDTVTLMVTTGRKYERYVFHVDGEESLMLNPNTDEHLTPTYHLSYRGREQEGVDVWLARDLARLPVKIRYTDRKGGVTEMIAQSIEYQGQP